VACNSDDSARTIELQARVSKRVRTSIELRTIEIRFDLSRSDVENLLGGFLTGALGLEPETRLTETAELPMACQSHLRLAETSGRAWTAWSTPLGPTAAWGEYDIQGSKNLFAFLLLVEWWDVPSGHHALWAYCDPRRRTEWTIGKGQHREPR
jgi:hypothetical protein